MWVRPLSRQYLGSVWFVDLPVQQCTLELLVGAQADIAILLDALVLVVVIDVERVVDVDVVDDVVVVRAVAVVVAILAVVFVVVVCLYQQY